MNPNATTRRRPRPVDAAASAVRGWPWRLLLVAALAFALGWAASLILSATAPLRLSEHVAGRVSVVSEDGAKFCLEPTGGGHQRCGVAYQPPDAPPLRVGDRVVVGVGRVQIGDGAEEEIMVIVALD